MSAEQDLINRIAASDTFQDTESLRQLLRFLFDNQERKLFARDLEILHYGYPENGHQFDPQHSRERIDQLKDRLEKYALANPSEDSVCELPDAKGKKGYRLSFRKLNKAASARENFWGGHLSSGKQISVICEPLLFFYDHSELKMMRFVDTNIEGLNRDDAIDKLKQLHSDSCSKELTAGHFYIDVGSILAAQSITEYFRTEAKLTVPLLLGKENVQQSVIRASPVVVGTTKTNTMMRRIFGASETRALGYRLHPDRFAWVTISGASEKERTAIDELEKVLWDGESAFTTTSPEVTIGIVTRIPNPRGGGGVITFISSDATMNTAQMAAALVNEDQLRAVFEKAGRPFNKPLPDRFEMLFLVRLWPGNLDDEATEAKLLACRFLEE